MDRQLPPFHLAIPVHDLAAARAFYGGLLGCPEGRSAQRWIDFNLFGHQLVCHLTHLDVGRSGIGHHNLVDGHEVPVPHFGVVLDLTTWEALAERLQDAGVEFLIEPHVRFRGLAGEQATMFFLDPSGNALEFKAFADVTSGLFAT
ncbi:MAG: VOC family protein [Gammaproteobacteria bacterium]|jgi:extradiol dioxygenase family protein